MSIESLSFSRDHPAVMGVAMVLHSMSLMFTACHRHFAWHHCGRHVVHRSCAMTMAAPPALLHAATSNASSKDLFSNGNAFQNQCYHEILFRSQRRFEIAFRFRTILSSSDPGSSSLLDPPYLSCTLLQYCSTPPSFSFYMLLATFAEGCLRQAILVEIIRALTCLCKFLDCACPLQAEIMQYHWQRDKVIRSSQFQRILTSGNTFSRVSPFDVTVSRIDHDPILIFQPVYYI